MSDASTAAPATEPELTKEELKAAKKAEKKKGKVGLGTLLAWNSRGISMGINVLLMGYLQIYCTDTLMLAPALVSTLLVVSKLLDAFTDMFIGLIIDKTETKWGKARPYEICIVGVWMCSWLLFSVPESFSTVAKCAWIFVTYALVNSVFENFLHTNGNAYMVRAFRSEQYAKLTSYGSVITMLGAVVFNITFPGLMASIAIDASGWSRLILMLAVPMSVLGILRMILIPEKYVVNDHVASGAKVSVKDIATAIKNNKYILLVALMTFVFNFVTNMGVNLYFWTYIVGDVSMMGVASAASALGIPLAFLFPPLLRKFTVKQLTVVGFIISALGYLGNYLAGSNVLVLCVTGILTGVGTIPASMLVSLMIIDCIDYNEWKGLHRMDGCMSSINTLASQIGAALGSAVLGYLLQFSGYTGVAETMPDSALIMIRMLFSLIPAVLYIVVALSLSFYKLDKLKPQMTAELAERRAATAAEKAEAEA